MSIHSSLRGIDTLKGERSVFSRVERIQILKKAGRFDADATEASVYGLPKVRTKFKASGKKKKAGEAEAAETPAAAEEGEAPAAPEA